MPARLRTSDRSDGAVKTHAQGRDGVAIPVLRHAGGTRAWSFCTRVTSGSSGATPRVGLLWYEQRPSSNPAACRHDGDLACVVPVGTCHSAFERFLRRMAPHKPFPGRQQHSPGSSVGARYGGTPLFVECMLIAHFFIYFQSATG